MASEGKQGLGFRVKGIAYSMPFNLKPVGNSGHSIYHKISDGYGNYNSFGNRFFRKKFCLWNCNCEIHEIVYMEKS